LTIYQGETNAFGEAGVDVGFSVNCFIQFGASSLCPVQQQISGGGP